MDFIMHIVSTKFQNIRFSSRRSLYVPHSLLQYSTKSLAPTLPKSWSFILVVAFLSLHQMVDWNVCPSNVSRLVTPTKTRRYNNSTPQRRVSRSNDNYEANTPSGIPNLRRHSRSDDPHSNITTTSRLTEPPSFDCSTAASLRTSSVNPHTSKVLQDTTEDPTNNISSSVFSSIPSPRRVSFAVKP